MKTNIDKKNILDFQNPFNKKKKFDSGSIRFKLWITFLLFSLILLLLLWSLQFFFLNNYYATMKKNQTQGIFNNIQDSFAASNYDLSSLEKKIRTESSSNDLTIYLLDLNSQEIVLQVDGEDNRNTPLINGIRFSAELSELSNKLASTNLGQARLDTSNEPGRRAKIIGYASYLKDSEDKNEFAIFIFAPLVPIKSTISILRSQLIYVTLISMLLALALSLYLSNRISKPIKDITASAAKMGEGNYNVKFQGGQYTEIQELAETLTHAQSELEKTCMYQKDLIANVSHDLRTPLTMIKSYGEMIRDLSGDNPEKRNAHLKVIIEETDRLNSLVTDMLSLSQMQARNIVLERTSFNINKYITELIDSYKILEENEGYHIVYNHDDCPHMVFADQAKIKQVINNLLNNAIKYCGEDKKIIVNLNKKGKWVRFSVTDHGQGIAPDEINHIWERYYKSSTHHARPTEGSGLGLSIVKEILVLHKARFNVESEIGKGSTFWFELPIVKK